VRYICRRDYNNLRLTTVNIRSRPRRRELRVCEMHIRARLARSVPLKLSSHNDAVVLPFRTCGSSKFYHSIYRQHSIDSDRRRASLSSHRSTGSSSSLIRGSTSDDRNSTPCWYSIELNRADPQTPADSRRIPELAFYQYQSRKCCSCALWPCTLVSDLRPRGSDVGNVPATEPVVWSC